MNGVRDKRRFTGDAGLGAFRQSLIGQLADGLTVVDTGFSTYDVQTDEIISQPIMTKPFREAWQQDYVNETPLFCSRQEPETNALQLYTVASPPVLNFGLELKTLARSRALLDPNAADGLEEMMWSLAHMSASTAADFGEKWNYLGPMTGFLDAGVHSSDASVRRAQNAERVLNFSIYNRARIFNFFGPNVVKGDYLFWCVKEYDVSRLRNFLDPRGHAVQARRQFPARELQIMGASSRHIHTAAHNTSYDPVSGGDGFTDPLEKYITNKYGSSWNGDMDYTARIAKLARDFAVIDWDEETDCPRVHQDGADAMDSPQQRVEASGVPQLVYEAYGCAARTRCCIVLPSRDTRRYMEGYWYVVAAVDRTHSLSAA